MAAAKKKSRSAVVEVYPGRAGKFRWRVIAANGKKISCPGDGYNRRNNARRAAAAANPGLPIISKGTARATGTKSASR
jgi:uncharacterized protein YegP (UPF0339 family)